MNISARLKWAAVIVIVIGTGIWLYARAQTTTTAPPTTAPVEEGTLVQSVSGNGSLAAKIQADITINGYVQVSDIYVKNEDEVKANQPLLLLHSLASASDKAKALASLLSSQDALNQSQTKRNSLEASVINATQDVKDAQKNESIAKLTTQNAQLSYTKSQNDAKKSALDAQKSITDAAIAQSKAGDDLDTTSTDLGSESATLAAKSSALSSKANIVSAQKELASAQRDQAGAAATTQSAQLTLTVAQKNLANQQQSIAANQANLTASRLNYELVTNQTITSPVAGKVVNLSLTKGATVGSNETTSSGNATSSKLFSVVDFNSMHAVVSVSEVDVASVKLGQAATLVFDAIPDKTFTGTVNNIDTIGTTTQGVTTYNVEIALDSIDPALKPGMAVSASIITDTKNNVLLVPSGAIQAQGNQSYVNVMKNNTITQIPVTVGDSNDTQTEITSGLNAGDMVVTSSLTSSNSTTSAFSGNGRNIFGGGGGFGGGARFTGGR